MRLAPLPAPYRRVAYSASFGLVTAAILFLRPLHWESVLGSEIVFEGQAVDRLVWICLFIGLGCGAASFAAGAYGASYQTALPGVVFVVLSGLALLNFSTRPGRSVFSSAATDVPGSVRAAGALIVAGGIAGRLVCLGALILLAAPSLRRRPKFGLRLGLLLGGVVAAPALFHLITLTVETPRFPASGDPSSVPSLFLRTESIALPIALFVAGGYIIATLAAMQTREAVARSTTHLATSSRPSVNGYLFSRLLRSLRPPIGPPTCSNYCPSKSDASTSLTSTNKALGCKRNYADRARRTWAHDGS